ncbi:aldehyde dehydrogenase family protein [Nocardia tengchongensis]|uniref:Aldehyde dehydrogenase family protein n=1 Tax=Nocardia tengchongensis TaxID=2055889 RepID=A0ABX8CKJ6_9NOCA|nr:aldehyde dehydrogenase family protein [Nocardia tengchongensis]QVI20486.1 aldehyde dehydrogenase family protein [Nocardia tengchongensis]
MRIGHPEFHAHRATTQSQVPDAGKVRPPMLTVIAPADGRVVDTIAAETPDRVRTAVDRLRDNAAGWHSLGVVGRIHWLRVFRNWLQDSRTDLVALLGAETGKTEAEAEAKFGPAAPSPRTVRSPACRRPG